MTGTEIAAWAGVILGGGGVIGAVSVFIRIGMFIQRQKNTEAAVVSIKKEEIIALNGKLTALEDKLKDAFNGIHQQTDEGLNHLDSQTRGELRRIFERIEALSQDLGSAKQELGVLKESVGGRLRDLTAAGDRLTDMIVNLGSISARIDTMEKDIDRLEGRETSSGQKISSLEARVSNLEKGGSGYFRQPSGIMGDDS